MARNANNTTGTGYLLRDAEIMQSGKGLWVHLRSTIPGKEPVHNDYQVTVFHREPEKVAPYFSRGALAYYNLTNYELAVYYSKKEDAWKPVIKGIGTLEVMAPPKPRDDAEAPSRPARKPAPRRAPVDDDELPFDE